jgi:predicted nucleotidyltransferase
MDDELLKAKNKIFALIKEAKIKNINIQEAYIFGSYARREQNEFSDIDVALISKDFVGNSFIDSSSLDEIILNIGVEIEAHTYLPEDFNSNNLFVKEILKSGLRII